MTARTYHIRRRLRRARGNQYYRDRSDRGQGTFCGAPETDVDIGWREKAIRWVRGGTEEFGPCPACVATRKEEFEGERG